MPFALHFLRHFIDHPQEVGTYREERIFDSGRRALISIDMANYPTLYSGLAIDYAPGTALKAKTLCRTPHYTVTAVPGMVGFMGGSHSREGAEEVDACVVDTSDSPLRLQHLGTRSHAAGTRAQDGPDASWLPSDEEKAEASADELDSIERLLAHAPWLAKQPIRLCTTDIYAADANLHPQLKLMPESRRESLRHGRFHLASKADKAGGLFFLIYNEDDFVLNLHATGGRIAIKAFFSERSSAEAQRLLNIYKSIRPLVLPGEKLHIVSRYNMPQGYDAQATAETIALQQEVATRTLPTLKKRVRERRKSYGRDYATMADYLKYQQSKEENTLKGRAVAVPPGHARRGSNSTTDSTKASLLIDRALCEGFLDAMGEEQDSLPAYAAADPDGRPIACYLEDSLHGDYCILSFSNLHFDIDDYIARGFTLTYRANVRHLRLQRNEIENFVNKDELLSKLREGKLREPEVDMAQPFAFKDKKFIEAEPGNNQPAAIRKALACNDIFLIQGPPGTGKTSVIVEIVRQLAGRGERVLVCSQAHSAVANVYERLKDTELSDRIGFLDEQDTMRGISAQGHEQFLKNNLLLLGRLTKLRAGQAEATAATDGSDYAEAERTDFMRLHDHIAQYHRQALNGRYAEAKSIVDDFRRELQEQADSSLFYATSHLRSLKVVMGTCIGVGMYDSIQRSGITFDTVIIDEAGKANYGETTVPMRLGKRHILVGDQRQLPPYIDREEVREFLAQEGQDGDLQARSKEVEEALSSSLFEDFLTDGNFPQGSRVLLNYQYRMHPDIGNFVSRLFYGGELQNGKGTQELSCTVEGYPDTVTFRDTQNEARHYENSRNGRKLYNQCEIDIVCGEIVPAIENALTADGSLTVGIVAPYREQVRRLRQRLAQSAIARGSNSGVFTIDSIQGREFDIVVLSFVRSFPNVKGCDKKVGFLDDIRRLNVALSRARKKLILVGDLDTLTRKDAHREIGSAGYDIQPASVFRYVSENSKKHRAFDMIAKLRHLEESGEIKEGSVISGCEITPFGKDGSLSFKATVGGENLQFPIKQTPDAEYACRNGQARSVMFAGYGKDRPVWHTFMEARVAGADEQTTTLELRDGTLATLRRPDNHFMDTLLDGHAAGLEDVWLPFCVGSGETVFLHNGILREATAKLREGDSAVCTVVGEDDKCYTVYSNGTVGKIWKLPYAPLSIGNAYRCRVGKIYENEGKMPMVIYKLDKTFRLWT